MSTNTFEQGLCLPQQRLTERLDVTSISANTTLSEVHNNHILILNTTNNAVTLTFPSPETCIGCTVFGVVTTAAATPAFNLVLTCTSTSVIRAATSLVDGSTSANAVVSGAAVTLAKVFPGTTFTARSYGLGWVFNVTGKVNSA